MTKHRRGSRIEGYNPNPGGLGGGPPIGAERGIYPFIREHIPLFRSNSCTTRLRDVRLR